MRLSLRKNELTSLFKEVRVFKEGVGIPDIKKWLTPLWLHDKESSQVLKCPIIQPWGAIMGITCCRNRALGAWPWRWSCRAWWETYHQSANQVDMYSENILSFGSEQKRPGANRPPEFVPERGSLGVIFSPRNYRENAHSKSANFEGRRSGGHLLGRPLVFTSESWNRKTDFGKCYGQNFELRCFETEFLRKGFFSWYHVSFFVLWVF